MRRTVALFVLATLAAISFGCGFSQRSAPSSNAPGTTTYGNTSAPPPTTTAAPSGGAASNTSGGAAPKPSPTAPGIKPPTD